MAAAGARDPRRPPHAAHIVDIVIVVVVIEWIVRGVAVRRSRRRVVLRVIATWRDKMANVKRDLLPSKLAIAHGKAAPVGGGGEAFSRPRECLPPQEPPVVGVGEQLRVQRDPGLLGQLTGCRTEPSPRSVGDGGGGGARRRPPQVMCCRSRPLLDDAAVRAVRRPARAAFVQQSED